MTQAMAQTAGALYLVVIVAGTFSLGYVPSHLVVPGDAAATVVRIGAHASLYRLSVVADAACYTAFLLLPLALFALLRSVGERLAVAMVAFATVSVPISFVNLSHKLEVLQALDLVSHLPSATAALSAYGSGLAVVQILWGLWLIPLGILVFRSGALPRLLGIFLVVGGLGYVVDFVGRVLVPGYFDSALASVTTLPASAGEIGLCLWLLVAGIRPRAGGTLRPKPGVSAARHAPD